jgi:PhnB protein
MTTKVKPIPEGYHTITPYLIVKDGPRAIEFYKKAFGAQELFRMAGPDGKIAHAELQIGNSRFMLGTESPQTGSQSPETLKGTPVGLFLYLEDVDAAFKRAVDAGAKATQPPQDMFWGDRYGKVADPFGHEWQLATHKEDVAPAEMDKRAQAAMRQAT